MFAASYAFVCQLADVHGLAVKLKVFAQGLGRRQRCSVLLPAALMHDGKVLEYAPLVSFLWIWAYASAPWATEEENPWRKYIFSQISVSITVGIKGDKSSYSECDKMIVHNSSQLKMNV